MYGTRVCCLACFKMSYDVLVMAVSSSAGGRERGEGRGRKGKRRGVCVWHAFVV